MMNDKRYQALYIDNKMCGYYERSRLDRCLLIPRNGKRPFYIIGNGSGPNSFTVRELPIIKNDNTSGGGHGKPRAEMCVIPLGWEQSFSEILQKLNGRKYFQALPCVITSNGDLRGVLPIGKERHHINGDPLDNSIENLYNVAIPIHRVYHGITGDPRTFLDYIGLSEGTSKYRYNLNRLNELDKTVKDWRLMRANYIINMIGTFFIPDNECALIHEFITKEGWKNFKQTLIDNPNF